MDILISAYPLYLTYGYCLDQSEATNLPFLTIWWSSFGILTLGENYAGIDRFPLYWVVKSGVLLSLYSSEYRDWVTTYALKGVVNVGSTVKNGSVKIINEHFPSVKKYVNIDGNDQDHNNNREKLSKGWFSNWFKLE